MSLTTLTATELLAQLDGGHVSAQDVVSACLEKIATQDPSVRSFLAVNSADALEKAADVDRRRRQGESLGKLAGLPVAIKDVLCTVGEETTCGSKILGGFKPPYDATVVRRLKDEDAVLIGKTNMDEFAMGSSTENSAFQVTRNPWDLSCTPGGSSGGSAACVAARMVPLSIGTDTGGSIRQPAAYCGVLGLKPTYGRVSRYGLVAFASSLDQVGPFARTAEDAALLLGAIAGHDPADSTSSTEAAQDYSLTVRQPLIGLKLGLVREHFGAGIDTEVEAAVRESLRVLESLGASVEEISLPHSKYAIATYYIIASCEASSNLARYDGVHYGLRANEEAVAQLQQEQSSGQESPLVRMYRSTRAQGFGPEVKRRIMLGTYALSEGYYDAYYLKALKVRRLIRQDYENAFQQVDLVVGPTTPREAFKLGEKTEDPLSMYLEDLCTVGTNLSGIPGLSLTCGMTRTGLPIGLQFQAPAFDEDRLLRAAAMYQQATDWHQQAPSLESPRPDSPQDRA